MRWLSRFLSTRSESDRCKDQCAKNAAETSPAAQGASSILASQEKEGITATVEKIKQSDKDTIAVLTLNNHQYDLEQIAFTTKRLLMGKRRFHLFLSNAAGGHHVKSKSYSQNDDRRFGYHSS